MAILEKFKYYKNLFIQYISLRFGLVKFAGLSVLIVFLGITNIIDHLLLIENLLFIFVSLFVFRLIDDAWSFYQDRIEHTDRTYILPENFKNFIAFVLIIYIFYQTALFYYSVSLAWIILILFFISSVFYISFYKLKRIMAIIPILKYPVFVWCIARFSISYEVLFLSFGAFFMMIAVDFFQENPLRNSKVLLKIALILLTGSLIMQPWIEKTNFGLDLLLMTIPFLFLLISRLKRFYFFPAVIFPILHIMDLLF